MRSLLPSMSYKRFPLAMACLLGLAAILAALTFATPLLFPKKPAEPITSEPPEFAPRIAPSGVYYLLEPTRFSTGSGIYRVTAGTELKLVARENGKLRLTDGQMEIVVDPSAVTDDLDVADLVRENGSALQAKITGIEIRQHNPGSGRTADQPPRRPVPPGYYCLLRRVSQFTDSGVVAWPPGTRLALMSRTKGNVRLTDGDTDVDVEDLDITNDLEIAELVQQNYIELQSQIRAILLGHHNKKKVTTKL